MNFNFDFCFITFIKFVTQFCLYLCGTGIHFKFTKVFLMLSWTLMFYLEAIFILISKNAL